MFEHACFISYRHPPPTAPDSDRHFRAQFAHAFREALEQYLTVEIRTFCDPDLRRDPGVRYPSELSQRLCRSVCLVAIIVPDYWESSWTLGEWLAMERLERTRPGRPDLIIPVIQRGDASTRSQRIETRVPVEFNIVAARQLKNIRNLEKIRDIARKIDRHVKQLSSFQVECDAFEIDLTRHADMPVAADPDPFAA